MKFPRLARRLATWVSLTAVCAGALVACGGATSQIDPFVPARLVVFGDEYSALLDTEGDGNGLHYGINRIDSSTNSVSCTADGAKLWVQRLAEHYGMVFAECNPDSATPKAYMQARYGAKVATLAAAIDAFAGRLDGALSGDDLVTIAVGLHDVVEVYLDPGFSSDGDKVDEMTRRGKLLAAQVNRVMGMNAKVLVAQVIDVGMTPWASAQGSTEAALITRMSDAFNAGLRTDLLNDGTRVGLLAFDDIVRSYMRNTAYDHYAIACDDDHVEAINVDDTDGDGHVDGGGSLVTCTTSTLVNDDALTTYLWADPLHVNASLIQVQMGSLAITRAKNNPFQN